MGIKNKSLTVRRRLPKKVMRWIQTENIKRTRSKKSWVEGVRKPLSVRGLSDEDCVNRTGVLASNNVARRYKSSKYI